MLHTDSCTLHDVMADVNVYEDFWQVSTGIEVLPIDRK